MTVVGTIGLGAIPPSPCFAGFYGQALLNTLFIDHEAREIMYLVASVRLRPLSQLNRVCNQSAHADDCADAVDRLLIKFL